MGVGRPGAPGDRGVALALCSAAADGVQSAAARASVNYGACLPGWGARLRGSASACAFGCRRTPGF